MSNPVQCGRQSARGLIRVHHKSERCRTLADFDLAMEGRNGISVPFLSRVETGKYQIFLSTLGGTSMS